MLLPCENISTAVIGTGSLPTYDYISVAASPNGKAYLTLINVQHNATSAPEVLHAAQPLPSPGSPVHLILRLRQREHCPHVSEHSDVKFNPTTHRYGDPSPRLLCLTVILRLMNQGVSSLTVRILRPKMIVVCVRDCAVVVCSSGHVPILRAVERIEVSSGEV